MSIWRYPLILLVFFVLLSPNQNCSQNSDVAFRSSNDIKLTINQESQAGNGEGFLGKPEEGDYTRTYYDFRCPANNTAGVQGLLNVDNLNVEITQDNCVLKDYNFTFADRLLAFSYYNKDYLGIGTASYERVGSPAIGELPIVDSWCRTSINNDGFDIVIKSNSADSAAEAKIYFANSGQVRFVPRTSVEKSVLGATVTYQSQSIFLEIHKSTNSNELSRGQVTALVDGKSLSYRVDCRLADRAPIEEMGVGITSLYPFNSLIADSQEAVCAHQGVLTCENYEDRSLTNANDLTRAKFMNSGWAISSANSFVVSNTDGFDGTNALELNYAADVRGAGTKDFTVPSVSEFFARMYVRYSPNYQFSSYSEVSAIVGTNHSVVFAFDANHSLFYRYNSPAQVNVTKQFSTGSMPNPENWHCLEFRITSGSGLNGEIEAWIDGVSGGVLNTDWVNPVNTFIIRTSWYCPDAADDGICDAPSHPAQSWWVDNIVVGTQRIGCF